VAAPGLQRHARPVSRFAKLTRGARKSSMESLIGPRTRTSGEACSRQSAPKFVSRCLARGIRTPRHVVREPFVRAVAQPGAAVGRARASRPRPAVREAMGRGSPTCRRGGRSIEPSSGSDDFADLRRATCTREQRARGGGGRAGKARWKPVRTGRLRAMAPSDDPPRRGKFVSGRLNRRRWPLRSAPKPLCSAGRGPRGGGNQSDSPQLVIYP